MMYAKEDDRQLIGRYIKGDESAFEVLLRRHKDRVYGYIRMTVKDRQVAEDVFQDVFTKAVIKIKRGDYNEEGKFLPWIMRIAHNLMIDMFRKNKRIPFVKGGQDFDVFKFVKDEGKNVAQCIIEEQILGDVVKLIDYLPEDQAHVLRMRIFNDKSFKEIADETNVSINTALGRMRYALINLRKLVDEHDIVITQ